MKTVDLAVVIPTLNEEKFIGQLLDSIYLQTIHPKEICIIDAESRDKTIEEIKKRQKRMPQIKYYRIPKYSIARQRNLGVEKTTASKILFLDADTVLINPKTLEAYLKEAESKRAKLAVAENLPLSDHWKDKAYFQAANLGTRVGKFVMPAAVGINLYCQRSVFERMGGFDESIKMGEDTEMVERFAKKGVLYEILEKPKIYTSVRRLRKEGRIRFVLMMINSFINDHIFGYHRDSIVKEYEFGKHPHGDS